MGGWEVRLSPGLALLASPEAQSLRCCVNTPPRAADHGPSEPPWQGSRPHPRPLLLAPGAGEEAGVGEGPVFADHRCSGRCTSRAGRLSPSLVSARRLARPAQGPRGWAGPRGFSSRGKAPRGGLSPSRGAHHWESSQSRAAPVWETSCTVVDTGASGRGGRGAQAQTPPHPLWRPWHSGWGGTRVSLHSH